MKERKGFLLGLRGTKAEGKEKELRQPESAKKVKIRRSGGEGRGGVMGYWRGQRKYRKEGKRTDGLARKKGVCVIVIHAEWVPETLAKERRGKSVRKLNSARGGRGGKNCEKSVRNSRKC